MSNYPKSHITSAIALAVFLAVAINALPNAESDSITSIPVSLSIIEKERPANIVYPVQTLRTVEPKAQQSSWEEITVRSGDSLSTIFKRAGLSATELHDIMSLGNEVSGLGKIKPGQSLKFEIDAKGNLLTLRFKASPLEQLTVGKSETGFLAAWDSVNPEILTSYKTAKITKANPSLYHAGKTAGLSDKLIMKMSYIFQWDISFALDLRQGDTFTVLYEDIYVDGEKVGEGNILAARFNNLGKTYTAVRYEDENGQANYFTPDGRSLRKAFLRDPVHFSHVSSSFNLRRLHPIHKKVMPHRGIDYAANKGTPVVASGDGKVSIARQNNASGRYVVIRHGEQYTTKYLHLSAFAKGIRVGRTVKQGQTIGYVGATGWATAAHLHYEFLVEGVHRNPRTVKLPKALPIARASLNKFKVTTRPIIAQLESLTGNSSYALASDD